MPSPSATPPPSSPDPSPAFNADLLKILRCPLTRSPLRLEGDSLVAEQGGLRYPIRHGIPVLLVEEAELPPGVASIEALKKELGF